MQHSTARTPSHEAQFTIGRKGFHQPSWKDQIVDFETPNPPCSWVRSNPADENKLRLKLPEPQKYQVLGVVRVLRTKFRNSSIRSNPEGWWLEGGLRRTGRVLRWIDDSSSEMFSGRALRCRTRFRVTPSTQYLLPQRSSLQDLGPRTVTGWRQGANQVLELMRPHGFNARECGEGGGTGACRRDTRSGGAPPSLPRQAGESQVRSSGLSNRCQGTQRSGETWGLGGAWRAKRRILPNNCRNQRG